MTKGKIMEGVFAINKPSGLSSAQVLRDLQTHFQPSALFAPYLQSANLTLKREKANQRKRRRVKDAKVKIGHGGTLDPLATGVLIAGVGQGTKSLQDFLLCTKTYEAVVLFGTSTDTYDRVGKVLRREPFEHVTKEKVEEALGQFRGKFQQLPPLFSALKMDGKPLYEYAREGKPIPRQIERRQVEVLELEMIEWMEGGTHKHEAPTEEAGYAEINVANKLWEQEKALPGSSSSTTLTKDDTETRKRKASEEQDDLVSERPASKQQKSSTTEEVDITMSGALNASPLPPSNSEHPTPTLPESTPTTNKQPPAARLRMTVTSGFYVRSLAHDLGAAVGSAALMAELERTRQGDFEVGKNVLEYKDLEKGEEIWGPQVERMLDVWNGEVVEEKIEPAKGKEVEGKADEEATKKVDQLKEAEGANEVITHKSSASVPNPIEEASTSKEEQGEPTKEVEEIEFTPEQIKDLKA
ncbi:hypothetical protein G7Y89_g12036 [Cudoniella acicularis]|uniref:tRNA pseudouridine(55) synthase n=1 Tax=Cudoniella acicularis TaxID=354080 RepID=A0A8H4VXB6_9HELO|nr:hypothetical protein G7Y89_g12036 [Cudoniella acicularis]